MNLYMENEEKNGVVVIVPFTKVKQLNVRIPPLTQVQLRELKERTGLTVTQIVILAIDRLVHSE